MKKLAIVIPAYKVDFFETVLFSLAQQTCKDFTVYIGEDCSRDDFKSLIEQYSKQLDIVYRRFEVNFGGHDLVAQWNRCIQLTQNEPWLWLFSDDDIMGPRCVEYFFNTIAIDNGAFDIYHFDVKIVDCENQIVRIPTVYPSVIDSETFYRRKASARLDSFVVEYIFLRDIYNCTGGFQHFDLAWGSDVATWVKIGADKGIKTISGDYVYWRKSKKNITPNMDNKMVLRKLTADIEFTHWINEFFHKSSVYRFTKYAFFRLVVHYSQAISKSQIRLLLDKAVGKNIISFNDAFIINWTYRFIQLAKRVKDVLYF